MKRLMSFFAVLALTVPAMADLKLARSKKAITCYGEDNQVWVISANRKTIRYSVEGVSAGPEKVLQINRDGENYVGYITETGSLVLHSLGDFYRFSGDEDIQSLRCE